VKAATTWAGARSGSFSSGPDGVLLDAGALDVPEVAVVELLPDAAGLSSDLLEHDVVPIRIAAQARTAAPYRRFRPAPRSRRRGRS
jgi:hypothetical protein